MNQYVLSVGSNLSPRKTFLQNALLKLSEFAKVRKISPLYENPPLLPENAPDFWYQFFLNAAVLIETELLPGVLLKRLHNLEIAAGRSTERATWAPRPLDIDIILMFTNNGEPLTYSSAELQIPHPSWEKRNFVVTPVMHLLKNTKMGSALSLVQKHRELKDPLCSFAAILNVTPDSFADNHKPTETLQQKMKRLLELHPAVLDIGAESTRPGATPVSLEDEWVRLEPFLSEWKETRSAYPFTQLSIDTRHPQTAERALQYKVSILNDVSGLETSRMQEVACEYEGVILMHSLSVPANPQTTLKANANPTSELKAWLDRKLSTLSTDLASKLIFDPGIGFGKTPLQSLSLLQNVATFRAYNIPLLIGHSRKSFMSMWSKEKFAERDFETLGVSSRLLSQVEFLRVHNLEAHQRLQKSLLALRGTL